jgi:hypothetical protein
MNIVTEILRYASPVLIDRVASALGIKSSMVRMAMTYAVPAILGAFATKAASPQGASALLNAVRSADTGALDSLDSTISGSGKDAFIQQGTSVLGSLLGNDGVGNLLGGLTKGSGLGSAAASMLLPMASQMVLGGLSKNSAGLDASGLANMLSQQKTNIAAAMPSMPEMPSASVSAPSMPAAASGGGMLRWLIPLIAAAGLAFWFFSGSNSTPPATTGAPTAALTVDGVDVGKTIGDTLTNSAATLGTITDVASAQAALPKLGEATKAIEGLSAVAGKFSAEQKTAVGALISAGMPAFKAAADKALAIEGVGPIAKPIVDGLLAKIEALAK